VTVLLLVFSVGSLETVNGSRTGRLEFNQDGSIKGQIGRKERGRQQAGMTELWG
jgi:hypothetical protein